MQSSERFCSARLFVDKVFKTFLELFVSTLTRLRSSSCFAWLRSTLMTSRSCHARAVPEGLLFWPGGCVLTQSVAKRQLEYDSATHFFSMERCFVTVDAAS